MFSLHIDTNNDAFADGNERRETVRILREIAERLENGEDAEVFRSVLDSNGNVVARFKFLPEE